MAVQLSWLGRIVVQKMKLLPGFCFLLRALILLIPRKLLEENQHLFNIFAWDNKKPGIKAGILQQKKEIGGVYLLNIRQPCWKG